MLLDPSWHLTVSGKGWLYLPNETSLDLNSLKGLHPKIAWCIFMAQQSLVRVTRVTRKRPSVKKCDC